MRLPHSRLTSFDLRQLTPSRIVGWLPGLLAAALAAVLLPAPAMAQNIASVDNPPVRMRDSEQWEMIAQHLPDPAASTPQALELQADILRARRFPEDAMDYYNYALQRGGNGPAILNKLGLVQMELRNFALARAYFQRVVKMDRKDADAWNNLGAVEFLQGHPGNSIFDYKKAVSLKKREAVFHSNLGTAFFEEKEYKSARRELATAMKLDPKVFDHDGRGAGVVAHVLSSDDRARMSFEMAALYAERGDAEQMLHYLAMASEAGMDVQKELRKDIALASLANDPRVVVLVRNAQALRAGRSSAANAVVTPPSLAETKPVAE